MSEALRFREDKEMEGQPERLGVFERNMIQAEILIVLGFRPHGEEKNDQEMAEEAEWMAEHRREISEIMDGGEHAAQIRELAKEGEFTRAAELIIGILELSK